MGWPQPKTPIQTDNSTASGVVNKTIEPKRTKSMDMRFHWLRCRSAQGQFRFYWYPGKSNLGDYFTKHFPPWSIKAKWEYMLVKKISKTTLKSAIVHSRKK